MLKKMMEINSMMVDYVVGVLGEEHVQEFAQKFPENPTPYAELGLLAGADYNPAEECLSALMREAYRALWPAEN